jgi:hypothetical protein
MRMIYKEVNLTNIEIYYWTLMDDVSNLWKIIKEKQLLVTAAYDAINNKLKQYWINLNTNNVLTITVEYNWEKKSLTELPRHIRFLMEINICSRLQLNYINNNSNNSQYSWLILVDDYTLPDDNDSIDKVLLEALSHQMIITKTVKGIKSINIKL